MRTKPDIKETIHQIRGALSDPAAPWYGSDVVEWVADLIEAYERFDRRWPQCEHPECGNRGPLSKYGDLWLCELCAMSRTESDQ